jgi:hypothetical protein
MPRRDFQNWRLVPGYSKRINKYGIKKVVLLWNFNLQQDSSGQKVEHFIDPINVIITSLKGHTFFFDFYTGKRKVQLLGEEGLEWSRDFFKNYGFGGMLMYSGSRYYGYSISLWYDLGPVYNSEFTEAYDGRAIDLWSEFELKPTSFLSLAVNLNYTKQNIRATVEEIFEGILTSGNIRYQISRHVYLTSYIQHDSHFKRINLDLLLGIELGMGNQMSLSYKGFYPFEDSPYKDSARSFVVKTSYLFRF